MRSGLRLLLPLALLLALTCGLGRAQAAVQDPAAATAATNPTTRLDADKAVLDQIEAALSRTDLSDASLQRLRAQIAPVGLDIQAVVADLTPRVDAAKARLAQLGPKPDAKDAKAPATPETADINADRTAQEKLFSDLDATLKRAKVLAVQQDQLDTTITSLRRSLFTRSILAQSYSLLDPRLWVPVVAELPSDVRAVRFLVTDWYNGVASKIEGWQLAVVAITLVLILAGFAPAQRVARRVSNRDLGTPARSRLRKVIAALWVALVTAVVPLAAVVLAGLVLNLFGLVSARLEVIASAIGRGVLIVSVTVGLARGFLAPRRANWRLPVISDAAAEKLYRAAIVVSSLVAVTRVLEALNDTISVGLPTAVASRGLLTALATAAVAVTLDRLRALQEEPGAPAARKPQGRDWTGPLRLLAWSLVAILVVAPLSGFVSFGAFLVLQIVAVSNIGVMLYMLLALADDGVDAVFENNRVLGRAFIQTLGLHRDSLDLICILLTGAIRVVLICAAVLLALAPWRIESTDMLSTVEAAFSGFSVGDVTISITTVVVAVILFLVAVGITRAVQRWLEVKFLPHTRLDTGLQNSIKTSLGYVGFMIASTLGLAHLGVSFERLAIVAGALSVGIGFGLQSIVNNFVSGLILLWERAVRVGDLVVIGNDQGYVRRINVRSTEIETPDRATVIVPNSNLMSGVVKNWVRNDHVGRIRLPFTFAAAGADPEKVRDILVAAAKNHDHVLKFPSPQVLFTLLGEANMQIDLLCFVEDIEVQLRVSSDLLFTIYRELRGIGLYAPAAPATVTSPALDKLDAWLSAKIAEQPASLKSARGG